MTKGEWQSRTDWHRVVTFGKLAEYTRTLPKGTHVMVQGSLRSREYESDGVQRRIFELRAVTVAKLDRAERMKKSQRPPISDNFRESLSNAEALSSSNLARFPLETNIVEALR